MELWRVYIWRWDPVQWQHGIIGSVEWRGMNLSEPSMLKTQRTTTYSSHADIFGWEIIHLSLLLLLGTVQPTLPHPLCLQSRKRERERGSFVWDQDYKLQSWNQKHGKWTVKLFKSSLCGEMLWNFTLSLPFPFLLFSFILFSPLLLH